MIVNNSLDEVKKRESALKIIKSIMSDNGRSGLYDVTGLSGAFLASENDLNLLETYVGPAIFEDELQIYGKEHLGGEKLLGVNRTSSGILATILALVEEGSNVSHFLAEFPAHPSIPRSCKLVGASYNEYVDIDKFEILDNTSLVVITGATMDHKVISESLFKKVVEIAHSKNIPVLVDDASGARLRTAIFNQKKAIELGADLVVTSTDKLMLGPRGGLMAGREDLINQVKLKATQFGLEAQPPLILAMVNGLKEYKKDNLVKAFSRKEEFFKLLSSKYSFFKLSPTGVMIKEEDLADDIKERNIESDLSVKDFAFLFAMVLLKEEGIITIPAVGMPGASATIRFDLSTQDVVDIDLDVLIKKIDDSFNIFLNLIDDVDSAKKLILG